jgi:formylglycine-generating enzyme required for sulfatase activity
VSAEVKSCLRERNGCIVSVRFSLNSWRFVTLIACTILGAGTVSAQDKPKAETAPKAEALKPYDEKLPQSVAKLEMLPVAGGKISLLNPKTKKMEEVTVKPFYLSKTEVTWDIYDVYYLQQDLTEEQKANKVDAASRPSFTYIPPDHGWGHEGYPAIHMSHQSVDFFVKWLSKQTGKKYRLPTEAEWELAARAGKKDWKPLSKEELDKVAWYKGNSEEQVHPVGKKQPNAWGFYDILGNTGEWCIDLDGKPVVCGGAFTDKAEDISPTRRAYYEKWWQETDPQIPKSKWWLADAPFAGLRLVCEP